MFKQHNSKIESLNDLKKVKGKPVGLNLLHHESDKVFEWLVNSLQIILFKTKLNGTVLYVNDYTSKVLEFDSVEEIYANNTLIKYKDKNDRKKFLKFLPIKVMHFQN